MWFLTVRTSTGSWAISNETKNHTNPNITIKKAGEFDEEIDLLSAMEKSVHCKKSELFKSGIEELRSMCALIEAAGYAENGRIIIDTSVVRGLEYYTGPVFEAEVTFDVKNDKGQVVQFGSVGGGGRYDGLVARFKGIEIPATGLSIGVSRLYTALQALGKLDDQTKGPVLVLVMDSERIADTQAMTHELRAAGIRTEMYVGGSGMRAQMKYADKRAAPCVIIQGSDEFEAGRSHD